MGLRDALVRVSNHGGTRLALSIATRDLLVEASADDDGYSMMKRLYRRGTFTVDYGIKSWPNQQVRMNLYHWLDCVSFATVSVAQTWSGLEDASRASRELENTPISINQDQFKDMYMTNPQRALVGIVALLSLRSCSDDVVAGQLATVARTGLMALVQHAISICAPPTVLIDASEIG